ncbi:GDYXXLXY domain-containing protein [Porphyrobacter sp. ULC335]|uniref:GDYXXLXY domain-containing protein n=1 Tax=Porphyrobacter sp. ULC335 TaxID=2854260 RepID=UPI00221F02F1|nr:GDYXXLXY domain-containing protein [Porphyrobacter sp. ULC335]UYV16451.1 GDYXXLXY domain-containing protein [Porphyrobacter sp. ULC335]
MIRAARLAAAVLPLVGLAALWAQSDRTYHTGTEWEVPIEGYDPRDYLRGHYVEFSYDWPGIDEQRDNDFAALCLEGQAPRITRVADVEAGTVCANPLRAEGEHVYRWDALTRGRLYIGQDRAAKLEKELRNRDQRGIVTIRQREDGSFTPISIRFRPLTPEEVAERDAQDAETEQRFDPPAIMSSP